MHDMGTLSICNFKQEFKQAVLCVVRTPFFVISIFIGFPIITVTSLNAGLVIRVLILEYTS